MLALVALLPALVSAAAVDLTARDGVDGNAPLEFSGYKLGQEIEFPQAGKAKFVGNKDGKSFFQFDNGDVYDVKLAKGPSLLNDKGYVTVGDNGLCNGCTYNGKRSLTELQAEAHEERGLFGGGGGGGFSAGSNYVQQAGACGAYGQCGGGGYYYGGYPGGGYYQGGSGGGGFVQGGGSGGGGGGGGSSSGGGGGGGIIGGLLGLTAGYLGGTVKLLTGGLGGYPSGAGLNAGNTDLSVGSNGYVQVPGVSPGSSNGIGGTYVGDNSGTQLWKWQNDQVAPLNIGQGDRQDIAVNNGLCDGCSDPTSSKRSLSDLE